MVRIYCDTNIYIDVFQNREVKYRDLGALARSIFSRSLDCEFELIISDWLLYELGKHIDSNKITEFFIDFKKKNKLVKINKSDEDVEIAKKLASSNPETHFQDVLHQILAKKMNAKYLITRDSHGFVEGLEVIFPEYV